MSLALLAACLAASVNTTCVFVLHVCPLPVSNYRLTLGALFHFIFLRPQPWTILRLQSLRTRLTRRRLSLLHPPQPAAHRARNKASTSWLKSFLYITHEHGWRCGLAAFLQSTLGKACAPCTAGHPGQNLNAVLLKPSTATLA